MTSSTLTLAVSIVTAAIASGVSWLLYRTQRARIESETATAWDEAARRLREDLMQADSLTAKLRAEVAWLWRVITEHWREHHPDEPPPAAPPMPKPDEKGDHA